MHASKNVVSCVLLEGHVQRRLSRNVQPFLLHIRYHSDDFAKPRGRAAVTSRAHVIDRDAFPDWILTRPAGLGHCSVNDHDRWCGLVIVLRKHAAPKERRSGRAKELAADPTGVGSGYF